MEYTRPPTIIGHSDTRPRRDAPDARPRRRALVNRTRASSLHALARPAPVDDKENSTVQSCSPSPRDTRWRRTRCERWITAPGSRVRARDDRSRRGRGRQGGLGQVERAEIEPERAEPDFRWVHRWSPSQGAGRFRDANDAIPRGVDRARSIARYAPTLRPRDRGRGATSTREGGERDAR